MISFKAKTKKKSKKTSVTKNVTKKKSKKKHVSRPTQRTVREIQIIPKVRQMILEGYSTAQIAAWGDKKFELSRNQMNVYIRKAKEDFIQVDKKLKGQLRSKYRERLEMMFHRALVDSQDLRLALSVQDQLNKLLGLYVDDEAENAVPITLNFITDPPKEKDPNGTNK